MNQESTEFDPKESFRKAFKAHRAGDLDIAEGIYREILSLQPDNAHAIHLLGVIALQKGRADEARELIEAAIKREDDHAPFHCNLGEAYRLLGRLDQAEKCFLAALDRQPSYPQALTNLGITLHQRGRHHDAVTRLTQALELAGPSADGLSNLGMVQFAAGALDDAIATLRKAVDLEPQHVEANNNLGTALLEKGEVDAAAFVLEEAVRTKPRAADAWSNLARARLGQSEIEVAEDCARRAVELAPEQAKFHLVLGQVLGEARRSDEAESALNRSLELAPDQAVTHFLLAKLFIRLGRFEEAKSSLKSALMINPQLTIAQEALSQIHSYSSEDLPEIRRLEEFAAAMAAKSPERMHLEFALAKMLDDCKEFDRAFSHLQTANALKREQVSFNPGALWQTLEETKVTVTRSLIEQKARFGSDSEIPILIVGMPRSGTTLVEQILSSHPEISGAGEVGYLNAAARSLARESRNPYPACLSGISETVIKGLVADYLQRLELDRGEARYVTDKWPYNFVHLGLYSMLFPRARVIHCDRDPIDTCLSIYFQNFQKEDDYAYDLQHIAEYYRFYRLIMEHWRSVLPVRIFDVSYEDLVTDQKGITRDLLEHCVLQWDDRCLRPHETNREILTASQSQVRQPVYSSSVAKWQRYKRHLDPLIKTLDRYGYTARKMTREI